MKIKFNENIAQGRFDTRPEGDVPDAAITADVRCIKKGWGREDGLGEYFAYHKDDERVYQKLNVDTVKILFFSRDKKLSRHYHVDKSEYFVLVSGKLKIEIWDQNSRLREFEMNPLERIYINRGMQHRMTGLEDSVLLEVSTEDKPTDSYRIEKGD
jgi:mannose-6-phosphate isomerase-like protein (cupin superfamily)